MSCPVSCEALRVCVLVLCLMSFGPWVSDLCEAVRMFGVSGPGLLAHNFCLVYACFLVVCLCFLVIPSCVAVSVRVHVPM